MPSIRTLAALCSCIIALGLAATASVANLQMSERVGDLYLLENCPVSGGEIGGMGDPFVKLYDGREVRFCCEMCLPKFEKDLDASFAKIDEQIIASQISFYPTTSCIVSGEPLAGEDGEDKPKNIVFNNRLVRLCCNMCRNKFSDDPLGYIAKLDKAVIAQQGEHYPLDTCPSEGSKLGEDPVDLVYGGRLVRFCCAMCTGDFENDPLPTIRKIDAAWMAMHEKHDADHDD
jgi:YHS domain-containing protein